MSSSSAASWGAYLSVLLVLSRKKRVFHGFLRVFDARRGRDRIRIDISASHKASVNPCTYQVPELCESV